MTHETNDYGELNSEDSGGKIYALVNTEEFHRKALEQSFSHNEAGLMYNSLESYESGLDNHPADGMLRTVKISSLLEETTKYLEEGHELEEAVREAYEEAEVNRPKLSSDGSEAGEEVDVDDLI